MATMAGYEEDRCALYRLPTRRVLARILFVSPRRVASYCRGDHYDEWAKPKKDGSFRRIEAPHSGLKRVQRRIAELLQRIAPPDFLFSPVKGRSYVDNAAVHRGAAEIRTLDISDFYPSCTANRVAWFFRSRLGCAPDVVAQLVSITTRNGRLPQGSPASPILAYFSYSDMWSEINQLVKAAGCKLSVYVDDLTISGLHVPGELIWNIRQIIYRYGHRTNPKKERKSRNRPIEITGVIIRGDAVLLPNRQHEKLHLLKKDIAAAKSAQAREKLGRQMKGRRAQARQILDRN